MLPFHKAANGWGTPSRSVLFKQRCAEHVRHASSNRFQKRLRASACALGVGLAASAAAQTTVVFVDPNLESAVRCALSKPSGPVTTVELQTLTCLAASNRQIANLAGLEAATGLERLYLADNALHDLAPLRDLSRLTSLEIGQNTISDLSPLAGLTNLTCLSAGGNPIGDYSVLGRLSHLTTLAIPKGSLRDASVLRNLHRLCSVDLSQNAISDLSALAGLTNLDCLDLRWNAVSDAAPLAEGPTNLSRLYLGGNPLTNAPRLPNSKHLTLLNLDDAWISNLAPLSGLTNLTYLALSRNPITNYSVLSQLTGLVNLELEGNSLSNLTFLTNLSQLAYADLAGNALRDLRGLSGLPQLSSLVLARNPLTNLAQLEALTNVTALWLYDSSISNADFAATLPQLRYLDLALNHLTNLAPLLTLTNLNGLALSYNPVADCSPLTQLTNLTTLSLNGDALEDLSWLTNLARLEFVSLNHNRIAELSALQGLPKLRQLDLRRNRLRDLHPLLSLPELCQVDVSLNFLDPAESSTLEVVQNLQCNRSATVSCGCAAAIGPGAGGSGTKVTWLPVNQPPQLTTLAKWFVACNTTSLLPLGVFEDFTPEADLLVSATASDPERFLVLDNPLPGTGQNRTLALFAACAPDAASGVLTVTVTDDVGSSTSITLSVTAVANTSLSALCPNCDPTLLQALASASGKAAASLTTIDLLMLTNLVVCDAALGNLCVWPWLTNLTALYLSGDSISNLTFATNLTQLTSLTVQGTRVQDLSPLAALTNLTSLDLSDNAVTNAAALHALSSLVVLGLNGNLLTDTTPLAGLTNLNFLDLSSNPLADCSPLASLSNLSTLALDNVGLVELTWLADLTNLVYLSLATNRLVNITPLTNLNWLYVLSLAQNRLHNIRALAHLASLAYVDVSLNLLASNADPVIRTLARRGVEVLSDPQRAAPLIQAPAQWFIAADSTSELPFSILDTGPADQVLGVGGATSTPELQFHLQPGPHTNDGQAWTLTVVCPPASASALSLTLAATNDVGLWTTQALTLVPTTFLPIDGQLLGDTNLDWTTGGDAPWFGQPSERFNGLPAAQSGSIAGLQESWLETTVTGPGRLTFWWRVSSEEGYDELEFSVGDWSCTISGEVDWQPQFVGIPPGLQTLQWCYSKDMDTSDGTDAGWLAQVVYQPGAWLELTGNSRNLQLVLHGEPNQTYQLQASPDLRHWEPLALAASEEGTISFPVGPAVGTRFFRAQAMPGAWLELVGDSSDLQLVLHGKPNQSYRLQASPDLRHWTPLAVAASADGNISFTIGPAVGTRFFRAQTISP